MPLTAKWGGQRIMDSIQKARILASDAYAAGFIQQTKFNDLKSLLNRAAYDVFHEGLNKHYLRIRTPETPFHGFYSEKGSEAYYASPEMHTLSGRIAKFAPHASGNPYLTDWVALASEWRPWAQIVEELRGKVAKRGDARLAPAQPKPSRVNPDQIRATCSCCFRGQAVTRGGKGMAHHGYTRPGLGYQTRSCMGVSYPPYELSNEGTKAMRQVLENMIAKATADLAKLREGNTPLFDSRSRKTYAPGTPEHGALQRNAISATEYEIKTLNREVEALTGKISGWQFTPVAGITA